MFSCKAGEVLGRASVAVIVAVQVVEKWQAEELWLHVVRCFAAFQEVAG
jgi:hypothetical protein